MSFVRTAHGAWESAAEEELQDTLSFDEWLGVNQTNHALLPIGSNALRDVGIHRGDIAIVERGRNPKDGDVVVARSSDVHLVRRLEQRNLVAAHPDYSPIPLDESVLIVGVVTAVIRKYH